MQQQLQKEMKFNTEYAKHLDKTSESYKMLDAKEMRDLTRNRLLPEWSMDSWNSNASASTLHSIFS